MKRLIFGCILLVSCKHSASSASSSTLLAAGTPSNAKECKLPSNWTKMDASFTQPADELVVLDWRVRSDAPVLVTEDAFVWYRGHDDAGAYWALTTLYRNPRDENSWHLAVVDDAPIEPQVRFDHPPANDEVTEFLSHTTWGWHPRPPEETAGRRCDAAWARVIGAPPPAK
jgi:hypothetical protein